MELHIYLNVSELTYALNKIEGNLEHVEKELLDYFQEAGQYAKEMAQMFAPIGTVKNGPLDLPHGKLRDAIYVEKTSDNSWTLTAAPVDGTGRHYAMAVEYGSNPWDGPKWVEGRPFMQPAISMALQYFIQKQALPLIYSSFVVK
jgi:hypothetical protein